jgi:hypothetical protein
MWKVVEGGAMVGWLVKVAFDIPADYKATEETLVIHW